MKPRHLYLMAVCLLWGVFLAAQAAPSSALRRGKQTERHKKSVKEFYVFGTWESDTIFAGANDTVILTTTRSGVVEPSDQAVRILWMVNDMETAQNKYNFQTSAALYGNFFRITCIKTITQNGTDDVRTQKLYICFGPLPGTLPDTAYTPGTLTHVGDTVLCIPSAFRPFRPQDTLFVYNAVPEYKNDSGFYRWTVNDSVYGTDSMFVFTFGMLNPAEPYLYKGRLVLQSRQDSVYVKTDSVLRMDSVWLYIPINEPDIEPPEILPPADPEEEEPDIDYGGENGGDAPTGSGNGSGNGNGHHGGGHAPEPRRAKLDLGDYYVKQLVGIDTVWYEERILCDTCRRADTAHIVLAVHDYTDSMFRTPLFLVRDTFLCAHTQLDLAMNNPRYRAFWLDADTMVRPYGYDTARFTLEGNGGYDSVGGGTDTRQKDRLILKYSHRICPVWTEFDTLDAVHIVQPRVEIISDTLICRDEPVTVEAKINQIYRPAYKILWSDKTEEDSTRREFKQGGDYIVSVFALMDKHACGYDTVRDTLHVTWSDPAMTDLNIPSDTVICKNLYIKLNVKVPFDSTKYEWRLGNIQVYDPESGLDYEEWEYNMKEEDSILSVKPEFVIRESNTYNVTLIDTLQCKNRAAVTVTVDDCIPAVSVPNVFTPNGDGVNDLLRLTKIEKCTDVHIEIVNRWGNPVLNEYVPSVEGFSWNGCYHNKTQPVPDGPYFYMIYYKDLYGKRKQVSGSVTVLR